MDDKDKVAKGLKLCVVTGDFCGECPYDGMESCIQKLHDDTLALLKEQEVIRCKDCVHRGKSEKCVLAAISKEKDFPLFMLDNRGVWFCADGERR